VTELFHYFQEGGVVALVLLTVSMIIFNSQLLYPRINSQNIDLCHCYQQLNNQLLLKSHLLLLHKALNIQPLLLQGKICSEISILTSFLGLDIHVLSKGKIDKLHHESLHSLNFRKSLEN